MGNTQKTPSGLQELKDKLTKHAEKVEFNDFEHTYTLKSTGKSLTSVSDTLSFFKKGIEDIPEHIMEKARLRGKLIHDISEYAMNKFNDVEMSEIGGKIFETSVYDYAETLDIYDPIEHSMYIINFLELVKQLKGTQNTYVLATEQLMYDAKAGIAGTADLILAHDLSFDGKTHIELQIIDGKTGNLRTENNAQVGIYQAMLKNALKSIKMKDESAITTHATAISLKTKDKSTIIRNVKGV